MGFNLRKMLEGAVAQVNIFDNGQTYSTVQKQAPPARIPYNETVEGKIRNARYGVLANNRQAQDQVLNESKPVYFNPASAAFNTAKTNVVNADRKIFEAIKAAPNMTGIPSAIDAGRLGVAELTNNQPAIDAATNRLAVNLPQFLPVAGAEASKPFTQKLATALVSPYSNRLADQQQEYAQRVLSKAYAPYQGGQAMADTEASAVKQGILEDSLYRAGSTPQDSLATNIRKTGGAAGLLASNIIMNARVPGLLGATTKATIAKQAGAYGPLSGISAASNVATRDDPTFGEYASETIPAVITGAAFPVVAGAGAIVGRAGIKATQKLTSKQPIPENLMQQRIQLMTQRAKAEIQRPDNVPYFDRKLAEIDQAISQATRPKIMQTGLLKQDTTGSVPAGAFDPTGKLGKTDGGYKAGYKVENGQRVSINDRATRNANAKKLVVQEGGDNYEVRIKENNRGDVEFARYDNKGNFMDSTTKTKLEKSFGKLSDEELAGKSVYGNGKVVSEPSPPVSANFERDLNTGKMKYQSSQPQPVGKDVNKGAPIAEPKSTVLNRNEPKTDTPILGPRLKRSQLSGRALDTPTKELTGDPIADSLGMSSKTLEEAQNFTNADASRPADFNAVAGASGSKNSKRLADAINNDNAITAAAIKAQDDGSEINFFAKKDQNNRSIGVERFDPKYHRIESGFVVDRDGRVLGNHVKVDETGVQVNVGGDLVNMNSILGEQSRWGGKYRVGETLDRNLKRLAPDEATYRKTRSFVIDNKIKNEANFKEELKTQRDALVKRAKTAQAARPVSVSKDEFNADVFDFIENKTGTGDIKAKYGASAQQIIDYKIETRKLYDDLLERVNTVFAKYGMDSVPKRKDYITHINELMDNQSYVGEMFGRLENSITGEGMQTTRGGVPGNIAGRTENFQPRKSWNRFFQRRTGEDYTKDPFKAVDAYLEPTLYNIHMTEPAVRARAVEAAFRAGDEFKSMDKTAIGEALLDGLGKYGGQNGKLVSGFQEYANALAGKTQRWDRQIIDASDASAAALRGWQGLQRVGGRATILGNVQSIVAQSLNQPLVFSEAGVKNYIKGIGSSLAGNTPIDQSPFIRARRVQAPSPFRSRGAKTLDIGGVPLRKAELAFVEQAWNAHYHSAVEKGYKGQKAILEADRMTEQSVAGRGIADMPEMYRSTASNGFLQYTLEVAATNKKFWQDLTPTQKAKYVAAVFATNQAVGFVTGFQPLPDFLGATIDTAKDVADNDGESAEKEAVAAAQRFGSAAVSFNPVTSAGVNTFLNQNQRQAIFGEDSSLGRFEGTAAPVQVVRNVADAGINLAKGELTAARDSALRVVPAGNQARKTITGAEMIARGYAVDSKGNPTYAAPTSIGGKAQALVFGPSAPSEGRDFYDKGQTSIKGKEDLEEIAKSTDKRKTVTEIQRRRQVEKLAKGKKTEYRNEEGLLATIGAYASAVTSDPATAIDRILSGQTIRRTNNGAIIVERMPASESQKIKSDRGGKTTEMKLDHTIPLQLGGSNKQDNLKLVTTDEWSRYTAVENLLGERLRTNVIDSNTAKKLITDFKSGKISAEEVAKSVGGGKIKNKDNKTETLVAESSKTKTTKTRKPLENLPPNMNGYDVQTLERFNGITTAEKDEIIRKEADAEYKLKLAEYERDKKLGSITSVEDIKRQKALNKSKVGATYDKNTRDAFGLNKTELSKYLATEEKGVDKKKLAEQILAYDDALTAAGIQSKNKFKDKYGNVAIAPKKSGSGKGGKKGKGSKGGKAAKSPNYFARVGANKKTSSAPIFGTKLSNKKAKIYKAKTA